MDAHSWTSSLRIVVPEKLTKEQQRKVDLETAIDLAARASFAALPHVEVPAWNRKMVSVWAQRYRHFRAEMRYIPNNWNYRPGM